MTEPWGLSQRYFHSTKIWTLLQPKLDHCFLTSWILVWIWHVSCVVYRRLGRRDVMCSLHLCICPLDNCSLGNCSQNCIDTRVLTKQIDASAISVSCRHSFLDIYHDICLITAWSANSSSDWKKRSQKKWRTDKTIVNNKKIGYFVKLSISTCKRASCTRMLTRTWILFLRLQSALTSALLDHSSYNDPRSHQVITDPTLTLRRKFSDLRRLKWSWERKDNFFSYILISYFPNSASNQVL